MKDNNSLPRKIVESLDEGVKNQLKLTSAVQHPGESGRARENIIREFIRKLVPESFGVDTGFVIDAQGSISRQVDIVIYRTDYHPTLNIGGVKYFLVESVVAVLENKARITDVDTLKRALENIASVKKLDRTGNGKNIVLGGLGEKVDPLCFAHLIFGAIVTQESLNRDTLAKELVKYSKESPRDQWLNLYIDVNSFAILYARNRKADDSAPGSWPQVFTTDPFKAEELFVSDPGTSKGPPPIGDLGQELMNFIRVAARIDFLPTAYFWVEAEGDTYKI